MSDETKGFMNVFFEPRRLMSLTCRRVKKMIYHGSYLANAGSARYLVLAPVSRSNDSPDRHGSQVPSHDNQGPTAQLADLPGPGLP